MGFPLLQAPDVLPYPDIRAEEEVEEKADAREKNEDEKPSDRAVGVPFFQKDHSGDKNSIGPYKAGGVFHEDIRKFAKKVI